MKQLIDQISRFLDSHESAPSAWVLVKSFHDNIQEVSDPDMDLAYNRGEGTNDSEREVMLNNLTPTQLMELSAIIIEISLEKLEELQA